MQTQKRIEWCDLLKLIAIFMMIAVHCTDNVTPNERNEPWYIMWGSLYGSLLRPAIPLFVIVTGALLLPIRDNMKGFYNKRLSRILFPFLIWSIIYNLFPWISGLLGFDLSTINDFFAWVTPSHNLSDALKNILLIPLTFSYYAVQMWYVYLLIGLYLYLPFFSAWVKQSTLKEQHFFLSIWFISLFIPYIRQFITNDIWGVCSWNEFGMLYYFSGFNGYLLIGYYLRNNPIKYSWKQISLIGIPMFIIGYCITFFGFKSIVSIPNQPESLVELFYLYCSPNVLFMTLPIAVVAQKMNYKSKMFNSIITNISICTFGIWMCHYLFLGPAYDIINSLPIHTMFKLILSSVIVLIISWSFTYIVLKWKKYGKLIMG